ncbi:hypothetical protein BD309DRAFT_961506 [Dichomitus squalens]|nr:hypothetical protein BD309DRAFT_961506 [Dichomitus squalens]
MVLVPFNFARASSRDSGPEIEEPILEKGLAASARGVMEGVGWRLLSFKSSTMLLSGPVALGSKGCRPGVPGVKSEGVEGTNEPSADSFGEAGAESPKTVVLGRKREAMMILWCLSELIESVGGVWDVEGGRWTRGRWGERNREKLGVSRLFEKLNRPHR